MAVIENKFLCDLSKPVQAQALKGNVFSLDNLGSRISVLIYENGQPATISGSITANCILPDGSTVNANGSLTTENGGSKAYVDVPQSCLLIPGILKIAIKCTSSSVITTLAAIVANVYMTKTDNVITPSQQIITDWNAEISSQLTSAVKFSSQSLTDTQKATARSNISAASASELQAEATARATADTTLQGNIDAEAATRAAADADLKSAFELNDNSWQRDSLLDIGSAYIRFTYGGGIKTNVEPIDIDNPTSNPYAHAVIPCQQYDRFTIKTKSSSATYFPYAFLRADKTIISHGTANTTFEGEIVAPENAVYLVLNTNTENHSTPYSDYYAIKGNAFFRGFLNQNNITSLLTCTETGWYCCPASYVSNITDVPSNFKTGNSVFLKVFGKAISASNNYIMQELIDSDGNTWRRTFIKGASSADWGSVSFSQCGYLNNLGYTSLMQCLNTGWYSCASTYVSNITDLPEDYPGTAITQLLVYENVSGSSYSNILQELKSGSKQWCRLLRKSGGSVTVVTDWARTNGMYVSPVKACIIGASVDAGTMCKVNSGGTISYIYDESKAWLKVALIANNVSVYNFSAGGMGYVRPSTHSVEEMTPIFQQYKPDIDTSSWTEVNFENIVNALDFADYDCVYLSLGSNDWNKDKELGSMSSTDGDNTIMGKLKWAVKLMYQQNPQIKIYIKHSSIRIAHGITVGDTEWFTRNNDAQVPYSNGDLNGLIDQFCVAYGTSIYGDDSIKNCWNILTSCPDGVHPTEETMSAMAHAMTGQVAFL